MNELQFPGLYIDDTANPHAILSFLCQSGYYCLILTDFLAEFGTKCGRVYCDYCDGTLISYRPDTVCVEIPAPCLWMVAFHPDLFKGKMLEKTIEEYTFFSYALKEALHVSLKEKRILSSCVDDIRREFHHGADSYKRTILIRHITRLLDYTTRFYERQFIVCELNNELLIRQYENLSNNILEMENLHRNRLLLPIVPDNFICRKPISMICSNCNSDTRTAAIFN